MATFEGRRIIFTADDEDPDCMECDNVDMPTEFCGSTCGPEYGWCGYKRTCWLRGKENYLDYIK